MPAEVKINMKNCLRSKYKESLHEIKGILTSLEKMKSSITNSGSKEMYTVLLKRFMFIISTVPDNYFLSDACEGLHELFVEFRIMLGYFENGGDKVSSKTAARSFADIIEISKDIYEMYRDFLSDPGYQGTNFPKSSRIRAMRDLARILQESHEVVHLSNTQKHVAIKMNSTEQSTEKEEDEFDYTDTSKLPFPLNQPDHQLVMPPPRAYRTPSPSDSGSSTGSTSNLLNSSRKLEAPKAPVLISKELSKAVPAEESIISAMSELMAPPVPPTSSHGRIAYVENECAAANVNYYSSNYSKSRRNSNGKNNSYLRPPIIVDDDGDVMPDGPIPQLRSAAASIYESSGGKILVNELESEKEKLDTEFILAYREQAFKAPVPSVEFWVETPKEMKGLHANELESSGWSSKSRGY